MDFDFESIEQIPKVRLVRTHTRQHEFAQWVHVYLVGKAREKVLTLAKVSTGSDHGFAAVFAKSPQCRTNVA